MKPSCFKILDALVLAVPGLIISVCGIFLHGRMGSTLMIVTGLCFLAIWGRLVWLRKAFINSYTIATKYKVLIKTNGYHISRLRAECAIGGLLELYMKTWSDARKVLMSNYTWVEFVPGAIETKGIPGFGKYVLVAGFVRVGGREVTVGYFNKVKYPDPYVDLNETAFSHELGHIILGGVLKNDDGTLIPWNEEVHHKVMKERGLP